MAIKSSKSVLERIRTVSLVIVATGVVCAGLYFLRAALVPFVIAAMAHFSLAPLVNWQRKRWNFPGWLAVTIAAIVGLILFSGLWVLVAVAVTQIAASLGDYQSKLLFATERLMSWFPLQKLGVSAEEVRGALVKVPSDLIGESLPGAIGGLAMLIGQGVLAALFLVFMLAGKAAAKTRTPQFMDQVEKSIQRYVVLKVALSAATGFLTWAILAALGVELALVFGVMAFLLNFIPNIGSVVAALLPLPILLQGDYSLPTVALAIALPTAVQFTIGNIVEPKLFGKSLGIHPVVVMLTLVLFGLLWGIPGMFLATPLTAIFKIVMDQHEYTKPIARVLEGNLQILDKAADPAKTSLGA